MKSTKDVKEPSKNNGKEQHVNLYCQQCQAFFVGYCPHYGPVFPIVENPLRNTLHDNYSKSCPAGMEIRKSSRIYTTKKFTLGTRFGPYDGEKLESNLYKDIDTSGMWEIMNDGKVVHYINGMDERHGNWLRYVRCSRKKWEQNLIAYQCNNEIYYRACRDINIGDEFVVWYGDEYANEVGTFSIKEEVTFETKSANHGVQVQGNQKPFTCEDCGKSFAFGCHLVAHQYLHTGERPFRCDICGKGFTRNFSLKLHRRLHICETFFCDDCGRTFRKRFNLIAHRRVHNGEKPFKCDDCGISFTHKAGLVAHRRIHTDEKPNHSKIDEC